MNQGVGGSAAAYLASPHQQPYHMRYRDYRSPECQVIVHQKQEQNPLGIEPKQQQQQHSINQDVESAAAAGDSSMQTHSDTHYLPGHHFNSGHSSTPQISGQNSPQLHTDQDKVVEDEDKVKEESVLSYATVGAVGGQQQPHHLHHRWRERDKIGLHLPYTLSLASTSCTGAPCGSHDSNLPPEINHREESDNLDIWGDSGGGSISNEDDNDSQRLQSCGSTGGDSGMIDEEEWDAQDTSPDFVEKALLEVSGDVSLYTV